MDWSHKAGKLRSKKVRYINPAPFVYPLLMCALSIRRLKPNKREIGSRLEASQSPTQTSNVRQFR